MLKTREHNFSLKSFELRMKTVRIRRHQSKIYYILPSSFSFMPIVVYSFNLMSLTRNLRYHLAIFEVAVDAVAVSHSKQCVCHYTLHIHIKLLLRVYKKRSHCTRAPIKHTQKSAHKHESNLTKSFCLHVTKCMYFVLFILHVSFRVPASLFRSMRFGWERTHAEHHIHTIQTKKQTFTLSNECVYRTMRVLSICCALSMRWCVCVYTYYLHFFTCAVCQRSYVCIAWCYIRLSMHSSPQNVCIQAFTPIACDTHAATAVQLQVIRYFSLKSDAHKAKNRAVC